MKVVNDWILAVWGVFMTDRLTDICDCRVASVTEMQCQGIWLYVLKVFKYKPLQVAATIPIPCTREPQWSQIPLSPGNQMVIQSWGYRLCNEDNKNKFMLDVSHWLFLEWNAFLFHQKYVWKNTFCTFPFSASQRDRGVLVQENQKTLTHRSNKTLLFLQCVLSCAFNLQVVE